VGVEVVVVRSLGGVGEGDKEEGGVKLWIHRIDDGEGERLFAVERIGSYQIETLGSFHTHYCIKMCDDVSCLILRVLGRV